MKDNIYFNLTCMLKDEGFQIKLSSPAKEVNHENVLNILCTYIGEVISIGENPTESMKVFCSSLEDAVMVRLPSSFSEQKN